MHLAIGHWIVQHRALPTVEPFAWTRAGSPFFAYSWLMELAMYWLGDATGKIGLRLLEGVMVAGSAASMIVLGWAARWDSRTSLLMAALHVFVLGALVSSVRPQTTVFILVPLAWAFGYRALYSSQPGRALVGLGLISAIAVNTHLFFPMTAAPWLLWLVEPPKERWRAYSVIAVTVAGWLLTPYAFMWTRMFATSFHPNLMLLFPTPVKEAQPGFVAMGTHWALVPLALFMLSIPLLWSDGWPSRSSRFVWGIAWMAGLIAFAIAARLLLVWWLLVLPLVAGNVHAIASWLLANEDQGRRLWRITAVWSLCTLLLMSGGLFDPGAWSFENPVAGHRLAPMRQHGLDQLAGWLECNTRATATGRVFTVFNYGSALTWRLASYSMSIDGRTIFPDSVAKAEVYNRPLTERVSYGPWRSADLAILPIGGAIDDVIRSAQQWHQIGIVDLEDSGVALWVTEPWWSRWGITALPQYPLSVLANPPANAGCAGITKVPPKSHARSDRSTSSQLTTLNQAVM